MGASEAVMESYGGQYQYVGAGFQVYGVSGALVPFDRSGRKAFKQAVEDVSFLQPAGVVVTGYSESSNSTADQVNVYFVVNTTSPDVVLRGLQSATIPSSPEHAILLQSLKANGLQLSDYHGLQDPAKVSGPAEQHVKIDGVLVVTGQQGDVLPLTTDRQMAFKTGLANFVSNAQDAYANSNLVPTSSVKHVNPSDVLFRKANGTTYPPGQVVSFSTTDNRRRRLQSVDSRADLVDPGLDEVQPWPQLRKLRQIEKGTDQFSASYSIVTFAQYAAPITQAMSLVGTDSTSTRQLMAFMQRAGLAVTDAGVGPPLISSPVSSPPLPAPSAPVVPIDSLPPPQAPQLAPLTPSSSSGTSGAMIAGIVAAVLLGTLLLGLIGYYIYKRRKRSKFPANMITYRINPSGGSPRNSFGSMVSAPAVVAQGAFSAKARDAEPPPAPSHALKSGLASKRASSFKDKTPLTREVGDGLTPAPERPLDDVPAGSPSCSPANPPPNRSQTRLAVSPSSSRRVVPISPVPSLSSVADAAGSSGSKAIVVVEGGERGSFEAVALAGTSAGTGIRRNLSGSFNPHRRNSPSSLFPPVAPVCEPNHTSLQSLPTLPPRPSASHDSPDTSPGGTVRDEKRSDERGSMGGSMDRGEMVIDIPPCSPNPRSTPSSLASATVP